jgi:hypothetical protein
MVDSMGRSCWSIRIRSRSAAEPFLRTSPAFQRHQTCGTSPRRDCDPALYWSWTDCGAGTARNACSRRDHGRFRRTRRARQGTAKVSSRSRATIFTPHYRPELRWRDGARSWPQSFSHLAHRRGDLAFVSQSGAMITAALDWSVPHEVGFSKVVSLGDMADSILATCSITLRRTPTPERYCSTWRESPMRANLCPRHEPRVQQAGSRGQVGRHAGRRGLDPGQGLAARYWWRLSAKVNGSDLPR